MSGYRTLHRHNPPSAAGDKEEPKPFPVWSVQFSPCPQSRPKSSFHGSSTISAPLRLLTSSGDGLVRAYSVSDKPPSSAGGGTLDASALRMELTEVLLGSTQAYPPPDGPERQLALGAPAVDAARNYTGSDPCAGEEAAASIELDGTARVWTREEQPPVVPSGADDGDGEDEALCRPIDVRALHEFRVDGASGTTLAIRPPALGPARHEGYSRPAEVVAVAVGCLDGGVSIISTGVPLHRRDVTDGGGGGGGKFKAPLAPEAGAVLDRVGAGGGGVPTSLVWHSGTSTFADTLVVGRKDGIVDMFSSIDGLPYRRSHRIVHHRRSVRALTFTSDGALLVVGCDDGHLTVHDCSQRRPAMVASMLHGHRGYVLSASALNDGKRFVTSGADGCVRVWDCSRPNAGAVHSFEDGRGRAMVWCVDASGDGRRLVSGGDDGMVAIYSSEE